MSDGLMAWLREQVDEDDRVAQAAADRGHRQWKVEANYDGGYVLDGSGDIVVYDEGRPWTAEAVHIARHDPARVLAEVAAKRRIIELHTPIDPCDAHDAALRSIPCDTLRLLASVYAGRPGWRSEWAPDEEASRG